MYDPLIDSPEAHAFLQAFEEEKPIRDEVMARCEAASNGTPFKEIISPELLERMNLARAKTREAYNALMELVDEQP